MSRNEEKTILVTGGSGFIGSVTCKLLVESGYNVINVDRVKRALDGVTQYPFDISNSQIKGVIEMVKPDAIIHLAAYHSVPKSIVEAKDYYQNNVENSIKLLHHAIDGGVKHFVFSSSSSVYGDSDNLLNSEIDEINPKTPYGRTKAMVETILEDLSAVHDFTFSSLRYFCAAGSYEGLGYQLDPKEHIMPVLVDKALNGGKFVVNGDDYDTIDGTCVRDYTHVLDIATAHLASLNYLFDGGDSGIFNIGAGSPKSIKQVIAEVEAQTGNTIDVEYGPRREGDAAKTDANISKAIDLFGWEPTNSLQDIVRSEIEFQSSKKK
jgi:UDP-glucose-4-epimerase GalE